MNQDSDKNDRDAGASRDGERRSFGRRDDAPRFNRSNDKDGRSAGTGRSGSAPSSRSSRPSGPPRFERDGGPRSNNNGGDKPRFNRERTDRPESRGNDRPGFNRNRDNSSSDRPSRPTGPRADGDRNWGGNSDDRRRNDRSAGAHPRNTGSRPGPSSRFSRDKNDRPAFNRDNQSRDRDAGAAKPRFDSDRRDNRTDDKPRPRFDKEERSGKPESRRPSFDRGNDRRSDEAPRFGRSTERTDRTTDRFGNDRNNRDDRTAGSGDSAPRPSFPRSSNRPERSADGDARRPRTRKDAPPSRYSRSPNGGPEKLPFKRVGGFSRDADERNNSRSDAPSGRRNDRDEDRKDGESRFSGKQRKESGDRRTGNFVKAPNYNLESRDNTSSKRGRDEESRSEKPKRESANDGTTRLNRYIANSGVCSRREADELIAQGDIFVNGKVVTEMGYKVKEGDTVKYGTKVLNPERFVYVLLNKPKDYITTTEDPEERKTVMELVADAGNFRMYPVGRLDRNTTGLLLVTNDGELADKLTHPSNNIRKIYQVELDKPITDEHFEALKKGIELEDGPIKPDALSIVTPDAYVVGIEIHSGRNRIVRRMFESLGYEVTKLDRTTYAGLTKKELPRGKWRFLDPKEVVKLKYFNS